MENSRTNGNVFITDHDYRFGLAAFVFVDEEILKGEIKKKLNDGNYDRNKLVQILKDGEWIDTELQKSLHRFIQFYISKTFPMAEHFLICMNEYNEENMRKWLMLQKSKPKEDILKEFENPTSEFIYWKNNKAKQTLTEYFTNLSLLGLKPYFIGKSNDKLLHPFGKSFHLKPDKLTHISLAQKYEKMFDEIYFSPRIYNERVKTANRIVKILNDETILGIERIMKVSQIFPLESALSPLHLTLELMDKSDEKMKNKCENGGNKDEIDLRQLFRLVNDMIHQSMTTFLEQTTEKKRTK